MHRTARGECVQGNSQRSWSSSASLAFPLVGGGSRWLADVIRAEQGTSAQSTGCHIKRKKQEAPETPKHHSCERTPRTLRETASNAAPLLHAHTVGTEHPPQLPPKKRNKKKARSRSPAGTHVPHMHNACYDVAPAHAFSPPHCTPGTHSVCSSIGPSSPILSSSTCSTGAASPNTPQGKAVPVSARPGRHMPGAATNPTLDAPARPPRPAHVNNPILRAGVHAHYLQKGRVGGRLGDCGPGQGRGIAADAAAAVRIAVAVQRRGKLEALPVVRIRRRGRPRRDGRCGLERSLGARAWAPVIR
ncbi:hypothetical protein JB92DRAFT_386357 [Gautieria morchelliformis]|nr:hypothetical protein JB92DRAFT_386357 [Gautieria morchelliformis]